MRQINFMSYELQSRSAQLSETERFDLLNQYFFVEKGFQVSAENQPSMTSHYLIRDVLANRRGSALNMALLYAHFAAELEIPVQVLPMAPYFLIKWMRSNRAAYIDVNNQGRLLSQDELVRVLNRAHITHPREESLEPWHAHKLLIHYAQQLLKLYERETQPNQMHLCLNILVALDPDNIRLLGRRALLSQKLGFTAEAWRDLKRFFNFVDPSRAPNEIKTAYRELEALQRQLAGEKDIVH